MDPPTVQSRAFSPKSCEREAGRRAWKSSACVRYKQWCRAMEPRVSIHLESDAARLHLASYFTEARALAVRLTDGWIKR